MGGSLVRRGDEPFQGREPFFEKSITHDIGILREGDSDVIIGGVKDAEWHFYIRMKVIEDSLHFLCD